MTGSLASAKVTRCTRFALDKRPTCTMQLLFPEGCAVLPMRTAQYVPMVNLPMSKIDDSSFREGFLVSIRLVFE